MQWSRPQGQSIDRGKAILRVRVACVTEGLKQKAVRGGEECGDMWTTCKQEQEEAGRQVGGGALAAGTFHPDCQTAMLGKIQQQQQDRAVS